MQSCSLLHWTLLLPPDTSTTEHCFHFGPAALFFLELLIIALYIFPLPYWTPSNLGDLSPMSYGFTFSYSLQAKLQGQKVNHSGLGKTHWTSTQRPVSGGCGQHQNLLEKQIQSDERSLTRRQKNGNLTAELLGEFGLRTSKDQAIRTDIRNIT